MNVGGSIARGRDTGDNTDVVGVSGGVGISDGLAKGDLGKGVGISLGLSLPLVDAVVAKAEAKVGVSSNGAGSVGRVDGGSIGGVGSERGSRHTGDNTDVVGVSGGVGISDGLAKGNLGKGVGIGLGLSLSLPLVDAVVAKAEAKVGVSGNGAGSIRGVDGGSDGRGSSISPVENGVHSVEAIDNSCLTIKSSLESGNSSLHLSNGVGISISAGVSADGSNSKAGLRIVTHIRKRYTIFKNMTIEDKSLRRQM